MLIGQKERKTRDWQIIKGCGRLGTRVGEFWEWCGRNLVSYSEACVVYSREPGAWSYDGRLTCHRLVDSRIGTEYDAAESGDEEGD